MGTFKDVIDVMGDVGRSSKDLTKSSFSRRKYSSLSRQAAEGTLQFPVIVSRSLDIETVQMISKALERNFASFTQIAMTMAHAFNQDADGDLAGYVRKFHQNMGLKNSSNDLHNVLVGVDESFDEEGYRFGRSSNGPYAVSLYEGASIGVRNDNREDSHSLLEDLDASTLNHKFVPSAFAMEANTPNNKNKGTTVNVTIKNAGPKARTPREVSKIDVSNSYNIPNEMLKNNDAKKANELVPTMMHMRVRATNDNGDEAKDIDFLVGIKAFIHPVKSDEMIDNIIQGLRNKGAIFNFIRWTSGEIGFFKDFLFAVKDTKLDVANQSKGHSAWWVALKRRKALSKINNRLQLPNHVLPNATMVLTMEEVDYIKNQLGYDLMNESVVDRLMKEYFLISFVVVDVGGQVAHFLYDGQTSYQAISFSGLERGTQSNNAMDMKDLMRLVQRI